MSPLTLAVLSRDSVEVMIRERRENQEVSVFEERLEERATLRLPSGHKWDKTGQ